MDVGAEAKREATVRDRGAGVLVYTVAASTYIALGLVFQPALNWIVGPVWIVLMVWAVSRVGARFHRRSP